MQLGFKIISWSMLILCLIRFKDRHAVGNFEPVVDASQDWELVKAWETDEHTHLQVIRKLVTCDDNDILINVSAHLKDIM